MICLFLAGVGQEKDIRLMAAKEERREALSIPEAREGHGSEHGAVGLRHAELHKRD